MRLFRLLLLILGLTFLIFGYEIYFKEKYKLVNNFENGLKDEKYAKKSRIY